MGKKGSWFSAIKRVFTPSSTSKERVVNGSNKKSGKERKGRGILKHGETKSFIPLFREPSSIEKILGEVNQKKILIRPPTPSEQPKTPPILPASHKAPPQRITSPRAPSQQVPSPRAASHGVIGQHSEIRYRPEPTLRYRHLSATKIQSTYRGYVARRSLRALRGMVRLQVVMRGQNVKRQTQNAMKHMQLLVRVQTQIQPRRIQMVENQAALQRQPYKNDNTTLTKWTSEAGDNEEWDDSVITKEEREARMQRKVEALIKRERAMAYAYSHKLWKGNQKSPQTGLVDFRSGGFPWLWNWLERQLPSESQQSTKNTFPTTPSRPTPEHKPRPCPQTSNSQITTIGFDNLDSQTPKSTKSTRSTVPVKTRQMSTPSPSKSSNLMKFFKPRASPAGSGYDVPLKDDDSLMSCPPFSSSVPNYMSPTVSTKAKARANSNPKDRIPGTPNNESKRRFSFPLTPNIGSFKWNNNNKGSSKDSTTSHRVLEKHNRSPRSVGDFSVDSAISMPVTVGRQPFNRYV